MLLPAILLLVATPAATPAPAEFPVEKLVVTGHKLYTPEKILLVAGLKAGEPGSREKFDAARERLQACGAFASVGYRYEPSPGGKGYAVTFEVVEVEQIYPVRFEELAAPDKEIRDVLARSDPLFGEKIPGTKPVLDRYAKVIQAFLKSPEKIIGKLASDAPGEISVIFRPESAPDAVAEVHFTGNSAVPTTVLQNKIAGVAVGVPYSEARFRQLLDLNIRPIYEARGRIRVAFPKLSVEKAKDVQGLVVRVAVDEGEVYSLGDVSIEGAANARELLAEGSIKTGDVANFSEVAAGLIRMRRALQRSGYLRAKAGHRRKVDDARRVVDVIAVLEPGPRYVFGKLLIKGLDIQSEPAVRKLWALKEGAPFNSEYPDYFLGRMRQDGVFDNLGETKSEQKIDDGRLTVDVTLSFSGAPPPPKKKSPYDPPE